MHADEITPGIYRFPIDTYENDPCPRPSLRASGIKRLLNDSPAEFAANHPRLTQWPELLKRRTRRTDEGSVAHALILGEGAEYVVKDPGDFLTKQHTPYKTWSGAAAEWKEEQEANGLIVIDSETKACADLTSDAAMSLLGAEYGDWPIGDSEVTVIWERQGGDRASIWCRARLDHFSLQHATIIDVKTTELSLSDRSIQTQCANDLWHIQAAWQIEGIEAVYPNLRGHLRHRFLVVQARPPFDACFFDPPESWLSIAAQRNDRAAELFAKCLYSDSWPGRKKVCQIEPPDWVIRQFENEEERNG